MSAPDADRAQRHGGGQRPLADVRAVRAAVLFGLAVAAVAEGLGAVGAFARGPVAAAWSVGVVALALAARRRRRRAEGTRRPPPGAPPRDPASALALGAIVLVLAGCLLTALAAPPNNGDVLAYHLPRVRHWIQNRSLAHYPVSDLRQISYPPGGSYLVAQLQLLTGGDHLASLPQWLALLGCVLVTAALARRLAGRRAALPAALACATVPMAVLQATNPQTDLIAAFWLCCFALLVFARARPRPADAVWMGLALGLGLGTKPTILLFAPPLLAIVALRARRAGWGPAVAIPLVVVLVAMLPPLPNTVRNLRTFGRPLGPDLGVTLPRRDARVVASNLLRDAALSYPFAPVWRGIGWVHAHLLHQDASDPATTFPPDAGFDVRYLEPLLAPDENFAASPAHVTIALAAGAALAARGRRLRGRAALRGQLGAALAAGFVLYAAALPWQPWANRLLLPLVVLAAPLVGGALAAVSAPLRAISGGLLGVLGIFYSLTSVRHPLVPPRIVTEGRAVLYFADYGRALPAQYGELLRRASGDGCARVALDSVEYAPEYLVWVTLDRLGPPVAIRASDVDNASRAAPAEVPAQRPCARVTLRRDGAVAYAPAP